MAQPTAAIATKSKDHRRHIPEVYALPFDVRVKIEKAIQMEFIGENR